MLGCDRTEESIVVEAAVLVIMYPLYVPSSAREHVCSVWAAACHRACSIGNLERKQIQMSYNHSVSCVLW